MRALVFRPPMDPIVRALQKALQSRIDGLRGVASTQVEAREVYRRGEITFLQVEICRDHLALDVWLPEVLREEARSSGIARAHPFLGIEAVVIRFERAQDLARVARWVESSHEWAPVRDQAPRPSQVPQALVPSLEERLIKINSTRPSAPPPAPVGPSDQRKTEPPGPAFSPVSPAPRGANGRAPEEAANDQATQPQSSARGSTEPLTTQTKRAAGSKQSPEKAPAEKAPGKQASTKKAPAKKTTAKKPVTKKAPAKKTTAKKPVTKKAPAKKTAAKKPTTASRAPRRS